MHKTHVELMVHRHCFNFQTQKKANSNPLEYARVNIRNAREDTHGHRRGKDIPPGFLAKQPQWKNSSHSPRMRSQNGAATGLAKAAALAGPTQTSTSGRSRPRLGGSPHPQHCARGNPLGAFVTAGMGGGAGRNAHPSSFVFLFLPCGPDPPWVRFMS